MASSNEDADLAPSVAAGYRITEKKTVDEYAALDSKSIPHLHPETRQRKLTM
jgi:hypothetical protein